MSDVPSFLSGGGATGAAMRARDWTGSPLGPPPQWPQSLRSVVGLLINSQFPMFVAWGPELGLLYNDAYAQILGDKHPAALGARFYDIWSEIWSDISPLIDAAMAGTASYKEDLPLVMRRQGDRDEQTWFTFSYSPVRDETGAVAGMFCACTETTARIAMERELRDSEARLRALADHLPGGMVYQIVIGEDGSPRFSYVSQSIESLLGITAEAVLADPAVAYHAIHPDDREMVAAAEADAIAAGANFDLRARFVRADGKLLWCRLISAPRTLPDGAVVWDGLQIDITDAVEAELALREERDRSAGVLQHMTDGFALLDRDLRILMINAEAVRMDGRPRDEILGKTHWEAYPDAGQIGVLHQQALTEQKSVELEHSYRFEGQGETWLEMRTFPLPNEKLAVFYRDITARKDAERKLRDSENRFRAAVRATQGILWTNNAAGEMLGEQPGWAALTGQSFEEYSGYGWAEAVHPDDAQPTIDAWQESLASRSTFIFEHRLRRLDGVWRRFSIRAIPVHDDGGEIVEWVGVHHDVTEQRAAEKALRTSEERYRLITDALPVLISHIGPDFRYRYVNKAYEQWFGLPSTDVIGRTVLDVIGPAAFASSEPLIRRTLAGERLTFEQAMPYQHGGTRYVRVDFVPATKPGGGNDGYYALIQDVSEVRQAADTLKMLAETLEQRVEERTAELEQAHEQLRQSQKLEAMGQLTGGVAHDFNNLLTPIIGGLDLLQRRGIGSEREQRLIGGALQSAERAKTLVQRLLAFARRQPLQARAVDIAGLVEGMADLVASTSGPQIKVAVDVPPDLPPALADPNQLEMAILNLSVNARDAMRDGGTLTIAASEADAGSERQQRLEPGRYVRLRVSDTGSGMDAETLARAVEPFFSTKGIGKGTGLGLSMVHGLASQLGGALILSSRLGLGTCAELWLPVSQADAIAAPGEPVAPAGTARTGRVLLVDDEAMARESTAFMLADLGYDVTEAESGEAALKLLGEGLGIDLLVTDHLMPGMTGADLAREASSRRPDLPVMIVSGYAEAEAIAPDLPRLVKPFRLDELAAKLAAMRAG